MAIRYSKLGYVELNVRDVGRSSAFYEEIVGLELVERRRGSVFFRCDSEACSVVLHDAAEAGFKRVGWSLENESQFAVLHRRLEERGVPYEELSRTECEARNLFRATRMVESATHATMEFYLPGQTTGVAFKATHTQIQRLGHVVFSTPQQEAAIGFFRDVLNFRESDRLAESTAFLRPYPSPYHHGLGLGRRARSLFHHLNFMVSEIDDIGRALNRFRRHGVTVVFGPGRHVPSGSVFLYFLDSDGLTLEYSYGMEEFPERAARQPRVLPLEAIDTWGAVRDPRMAATGEMEAAVINPR